jgi:hypothetical protein
MSFPLSWYPGIDLDHLELLYTGDLNDVDTTKLCKHACSITECVDTDMLFEAGDGEGDEDMGDLELEMSGFIGSPIQTPEDSAHDLDPAPPSPVATNFVLAAMMPEDSLLEPVDALAGP